MPEETSTFSLWPTAYHESGHAALARRFGVRVQQIHVNADGSGASYHRYPRGFSPHARAAVVLGGAVAEARHLGDRKVFRYLSADDKRHVVQLAESAGCRGERQVKRFFRSAKEQAIAILHQPAAWSAVESLARQLAESNGRVIYESLPPELAPEPDPIPRLTKLQEAAAAALWAKNYP